MICISAASRRRSGAARLATPTLSPIQKLESRAKTRFGSGSITKSCRSRSSNTTPQPAESSAGGNRLDRHRSGRLIFQRILQQLGDVEHVDSMLAQDASEGVVLFLEPCDPGRGVKEDLMAVARGYPAQLMAGPVHQHAPQPAGLAVNAVCPAHGSPCTAAPRPTGQAARPLLASKQGGAASPR